MMQDAALDKGRSYRPTLPSGEFLGSKRLLRSHTGWQAYQATYPPSFSCATHDHERSALCMVISGGYRESAGGRSIDISPGSIVQQPAGNHHADEHGDQSVELLILEFEDDYLQRLQEAAPVLTERAFRADAEMTRVVARLRREIEAVDAAAPLACEAIVLETLVEMTRGLPSDRDRRPAWIQRVEDRLREFSLPPASLADLAGELGLHPVHLARAFRRHHGVSIGTYRRQLMVEEARRQIIGSDLPLSSIAADIGFSDQSHMTRLFKASLGTTPAQHRK